MTVDAYIVTIDIDRQSVPPALPLKLLAGSFRPTANNLISRDATVGERISETIKRQIHQTTCWPLDLGLSFQYQEKVKTEMSRSKRLIYFEAPGWSDTPWGFCIYFSLFHPLLQLAVVCLFH